MNDKYCENISELHPVDEFMCSKCGLHLEGWTRVEYDEDTEDTTYHEYELKYCPGCGRQIVEE